MTHDMGPDHRAHEVRDRVPRAHRGSGDREITATLGVPVRRVEAAAWFFSGLACGAAGLILPDLLTSLDYSALTFLVISALAAALIGRLRSLWATLFGGLAVGLAQSVVTPYASISAYRSAAPFVLAIARTPVPLAAPGRHDLAGRDLALDDGSDRPHPGDAHAAPSIERGTIVRGVVIAVLLLLALVVVPEFLGADWITTLTSIAIYSVAALGFSILYGRVGMISLGQVALLTIGCWIGTGSPTAHHSRSRCSCSLPGASQP